MTWQRAEFPQPPRLPDDTPAPDGVLPAGRLPVVDVPRAMVTPFEAGPLRRLGQPPTRWLRGAVHRRNGRLVVASQRLNATQSTHYAAADPRNAKVGPKADRLSGTWLYAGHLFLHFGHFLVETLPNLWLRPPQIDGLLFHRGIHDPATAAAPTDMHRELLAAAGFGGLPIHVVGEHGARVERVLVPGRPFVVGAWAHPEAVEVWRRVASTISQRTPSRAGRRIYLSRTRFHARQSAAGILRRIRATPERDRRLDAAFAEAGFDVVAPEELPLAEQVATAAGAEIIAGPAGSALHLAAFTPAPAKVIEVGDDRSPAMGLRNQQVINAACGHEHRFVRAAESVRKVLADTGLLG